MCVGACVGFIVYFVRVCVYHGLCVRLIVFSPSDTRSFNHLYSSLGPYTYLVCEILKFVKLRTELHDQLLVLCALLLRGALWQREQTRHAYPLRKDVHLPGPSLLTHSPAAPVS